MARKIGALVVALTAVAVCAATAQQQPQAAPAQPKVQTAAPLHASIGAIKQVEAATNTIVVTPIGGTDQTFLFGPSTTVKGLAGAKGVPALAAKLGDKVVLHFAVVDGKSEVRVIEYVGAAEIQQFSGAVTKVDSKARMLTLKPATGPAMEFTFAPRPTLELKSGIVAFAQLGQFTKQQATVYYTTHGNEKLVWFMQEIAPTPVSLR